MLERTKRKNIEQSVLIELNVLLLYMTLVISLCLTDLINVEANRVEVRVRAALVQGNPDINS